MVYKGIAVSSGLGLAKCMIIDSTEPDNFDLKCTGECSIDEEKAKVSAAVEKAVFQLETIKKKAEDTGITDRVEIM